jgi:CheY-like chemotaxis protein
VLFKTKHTERQEPPASTTPPKKEDAKACLRDADKALKEKNFDLARRSLEKAKELDPSNPYIYAFIDRIDHFEEEELKKQSARRPVALPEKETLSSATTPPQPAEQAPKTPPPRQPTPAASPASTAHVEHAPPPTIAPHPTQAVPSPSHEAPASPELRTPPRIERAPHHAAATTPEVHQTLETMKRQIEELTRSLDQERKAREQIDERQLQAAVKQLRTELEKAWKNGAPKETEAERLRQLGASMGITTDIEQSIIREVKLDMYSRAVKEVIAKRKLLRSSSSTLEWLRKVYNVSIAEYLENESRFLLDLVADQYKGTLLLVAGDEDARQSLSARLKTVGYAVVCANAPEAALEKIEKVNPNLILCEKEFSNGSLSGLKFLNLLRVNSKFSYTPFVLFCPPADIEQLSSSELRPNEGYIPKPVDFDALTALMNQKINQFREYIASL